MKIEDLLAHFSNKRQTASNRWQCQCPNHDDKTASLTVTLKDNKVLMHCHAGCATRDVLEKVGLSMADLDLKLQQKRLDWTPPKDNGRGDTLCHQTVIKPRIVAEYNYTDEAGNLLFQALRMEPKSFRQRRPDANGGWAWDLADVRRVLYRLPDVIEAAALGRQVLIVEGEKDVEAALQLGYTATCCPMGAGKWQPEFSDFLTGANAVIICDNDKPGREHGQKVAQSLLGKTKSIKVIERLPDVPEKGDLSDWVAS